MVWIIGLALYLVTTFIIAVNIGQGIYYASKDKTRDENL